MRLANLSARRRRLVLGVLVVAVALAGVVGVRLATRRSGAPSGFPDQSRPGPVLLVPGYGGATGSLAPLAARIRATGRVATVVPLPGDGTGDLEAQAAAVQAAVGRALGSARSVDLIGYSAGGVAVLLWLDRFDGAHVARRVVSLGAPLHGTRLAGLGGALVPDACPVACQQLVPGSSLLTRLDAVPLPAPVPWLSIWTGDDQTVTPPDSAALAGAVNVQVQQICPDATVQHGQLPSDPLVTGLVLRAVGAAPLSAPVPADCAALRAQGAG